MKKIFLTSGLILCMASPAFATDPLHDITSDGKDATNTSITANCTEPYLGSYTGPVSFEAKWNNICYAGGVNLDPKRYTSSSDNSGFSATSQASPASVYIEYDVGMFTGNTCAAGTRVTNDTLTSTPTLTGYTFGGFYDTKANATASSTPDTEHLMINDSGVLTNAGKTNTGLSNTSGTASTWYARWTAIEVDVTWSCGTYGPSNTTVAGSVTNPPTKFTYDAVYTLPSTATGCTRPDGWHFKGWSCSYDPSTGSNVSPATSTTIQATCGNTDATINVCTVASSNDKFKGTTNISCDAVWEANTVKPISWNDNLDNKPGATASSGGASQCTYGGTLTIPSTKPVKPGYTFQGWCAGTGCASN